MNRPTKEEVFMRIANIVSERSTCSERSVGCVIASPDYEDIYSIGYNGNAAGRINSCDYIGYKNSCGCVHAEQNALIKCHVKDKKKVMFCTLAPCQACAKLIINSGLSKLYYAEDWHNTEGLDIIREAGIEVYKV